MSGIWIDILGLLYGTVPVAFVGIAVWSNSYFSKSFGDVV